MARRASPARKPPARKGPARRSPSPARPTPAPTPSPDTATRLRLIEAAGPVFARTGFEGATVREIVAAAGANVAAVNYHFGDKLALYRAVLEHYAAAAVAAHPIPPATDDKAQAPKRLHAFIAAFLERLFHDGKPAWMSQIIAREMVDPTPAFLTIAQSHMHPQHTALCGILSALTSLPPADPRLQRCAASVIAQCVTYKQCKAAHQHLTPNQTYDPAGRAQLAAHIFAFSMAGIHAVTSEPAP